MPARHAADGVRADGVRADGVRADGVRAERIQVRGRRLARAVAVLARPRGADPGYGLMPGAPEMVENDYYRFLNHPRD